MAGHKRRSDCAVACTLDVIGDRWSLLVVRDLFFGGEMRFADLAASREGMASNILTDRLQRLTEAGIVVRSQYQEHPARYSYRLTDRGRALGPVLREVAAWGLQHIPGTRRLEDAATQAPTHE